MHNHVLKMALMGIVVFGIGSCAAAAAPAAKAKSGGDVSVNPASAPCTPSNTTKAPADGLIADFADTGEGGNGIEIPALILNYAAPKAGGPGSPATTTAGGVLTIKVGVSPTSKPQFVGTVVHFNRCIDASAFSGVQFTVAGSLSGCRLQYGTADVQHQDMTVGSPFASGLAGSYPPQNVFDSESLTSKSQVVRAPFVGSDIKGDPAAPLDPSKLISVVWQFVVPVAAENGEPTPTCAGTIAIDDVKFYR